MNLNSLCGYAGVVGDEVIVDLVRQVKKLEKRHILNINSTFLGGGVAEILNSLMPLANTFGMDYEWRVLHGSLPFYEITKQIHNGLQGENIIFTEEDKAKYRAINNKYATYTKMDQDCVIIHDPQPLPLIQHVSNLSKMIWRCVCNSYILSNNGFELIDDIILDNGVNDCELSVLGIKDYIKVNKVLKTRDQVFKLTTKRGYELEITKDHPILCWGRDCILKFKNLNEIKDEDYIVINRDFPYLIDEGKDISFKCDFSKIKTHPKLPLRMTVGLARLIGYMIADGNFFNNGIEIANVNDFVVRDIFSICSSMGLKPYINGNHVTINNKVFYEFMKYILDNPKRWIARYKYLPKSILQSSKEIQLNCLQAYFDCDSTFQGHTFTTSTISEELSKQIHILLLNFGIIARRFEWGVKLWRISITGKDLQLLKDNIGYNKYDIQVKDKFNTNIDIIPYLREYLGIPEKILNAKNMSWDKFTYLVENINENRIYFRKGSGYNPTLIKDKVLKVSDEINTFFFDKLNKIECLGEKDVYDFNIPKRPYFWSNGYTSHNCHIDLSKPNEKLWNYLKDYLLLCDLVIVSREEYKKDDLAVEQRVIPPAIDPFSPKNMELPVEKVNWLITLAGIPIDKPIITQVSRMDKWKDPEGLLEIYELVRKKVDCRLLYCFNSATDDPEGAQILNKIKKKAKDLIERKDVLLIEGDNPYLVNAIQRYSDIIVQKSTKEGFCLAVTEALWKKTPVVASNVGGIPSQIIDGETGYLIDPNNYQDFADVIELLIKDRTLANTVCVAAKEFVREKFLLTRLLKDYLNIFEELL